MSKVGGRSVWDPKKRKARQKIRDDVRRGNRSKPSSCSSCGKATSAQGLSGHHGKYDKATSVKWLCAKCHHKANAKKGERVNQHG